MKIKPYILIVFLFTGISSIAQAPAIEWEKSLGGSDWDIAYSAQQTTDGGYIIAGFTESDDGDVSQNNGKSDFWLVKLDNSGSIVWEKNMGGSEFDDAYSIKQTTDNGYIIAGATLSVDGDVTQNNGSNDCWIIKLDTNSDMEWEKTLGGSGWDIARSIEQTTDGGYILAGYSDSSDGDVSENKGGMDFWVVKLNAVGEIEWEKSLGGTETDYATCVRQTLDGGFIVAGMTYSSNGDVSNNYGNGDFWVVKLDALGTLQWEKNYGGSGYDVARDIQSTDDGGYIVVGLTESSDFDVSGNNGGADFWILKLNNVGDIEWENALGGNDWDAANSVQQTADGGYIVAGVSVSSNGNVGGNYGEGDFWIVKLNNGGVLLWEKNYGGSGWEEAFTVQQTVDGGYIVAGGSTSVDGDIANNHGIIDFWVVKLSGETLDTTNNTQVNLDIYPNPTTGLVYFRPDDIIKNVSLYNLSGQKLYAEEIGMPTVIDLSGLPKGIYILEATVNGVKGNYKIIKE